MSKLVLEINQNQVDKTANFGNSKNSIMICPSVDENYWTYRVKLYKDQSILGFPKFTVIGIGFSQEEDWNTNLPSSCGTKEIFNHIKHNKKYNEIKDNDVIKAIEMIRQAANN